MNAQHSWIAGGYLWWGGANRGGQWHVSSKQPTPRGGISKKARGAGREGGAKSSFPAMCLPVSCICFLTLTLIRGGQTQGRTAKPGARGARAKPETHAQNQRRVGCRYDQTAVGCLYDQTANRCKQTQTGELKSNANSKPKPY